MADDDYADHCRAVAAAFADAYRSYVGAKVAAYGLEADEADAAVTRGEAGLVAAFDAWVNQAPREQRASPLELFREALAAPTELLAEREVAAPERDPAAVEALPGDRYDLAPATSQDLGEAAWQAHVAWGIARAGAVAGVVPRPPAPVAGATAVVVSTNLMDRTAIEEAGAAAGCEVAVWRNPAAIADGLATGTPSVAFVDLAHGAAHDAIRTLHGAGVRVVAFGPHVDDMAMAAAGALGADEVLARSIFFRRLPGLFPTAV